MQNDINSLKVLCFYYAGFKQELILSRYFNIRITSSLLNIDSIFASEYEYIIKGTSSGRPSSTFLQNIKQVHSSITITITSFSIFHNTFDIS